MKNRTIRNEKRKVVNQQRYKCLRSQNHVFLIDILGKKIKIKEAKMLQN